MEVLVTIPAQPRHRAMLEGALPEGRFTYLAADALTAAELKKAEIIIGNIPPARIPEAKSLQWIQLNSAGADTYAAALPQEVLLTNSTGAYGLNISESMIGMILMLQKNLNLYQRNQMKCLWHDEGAVTSIWNSTTLVVGLGDIGGTFAQKMRALGSHVIGVRRHKTALPEYLDELATMDELDELLPRADIVTLSLPNSPATRNLMNAARLAKMKPGSILVNVGRGTAVDSDALAAALKTGPMAGAALDVTNPEPLPPEHPLWQCENCIITPHVTGDYHLPETFERIVRIAADNLARFAAGQPLHNNVDRSSGYRAFEQQEGEKA